MQRRSALFRQLAKADLLVLDDFGLAPLSDETVRDPPGRAHDGQIITIRPNLRWTSDGLEISC